MGRLWVGCLGERDDLSERVYYSVHVERWSGPLTERSLQSCWGKLDIFVRETHPQNTQIKRREQKLTSLMKLNENSTFAGCKTKTMS